MASPRCPSFSSSSEKPEKSRENSELPSDLLLSEDGFWNEFRNLNYDTGFQTAPSSPPHTSVSADSSLPAKESTTDISSLTLPKLLRQPNMVPSPILLQGRDAVPSHHLLKVKSFSSLSKAPIEKYCSEFEAGGYEWNLSIYPTGDKSKDGEGHISMYLEMVDTSSLLAGWEVNSIFNFFLFDQFRDKYVGPQDATVRQFHCLKTQWGSNQMFSAFGFRDFMSQAKFKDPENGYLVDDACIIEAEFEVLGLVTVE